MEGLDAHEKPPEAIRLLYKKYQKLSLSEIDSNPDIIDPRRADEDGISAGGLIPRGYVRSDVLKAAFAVFMRDTCEPPGASEFSIQDIPIYEHPSVSGLQILPSILSPAVQSELLSRLLHRDLSNEKHRTNLHLHYNVTYPRQEQTGDRTTNLRSTDLNAGEKSFFNDEPTRILSPIDPQVHKPLSVKRVLERKLRWITLGGQYNWTEKKYPSESSPPFPKDIATLLRQMFPDTDAQAAIVNIYSPGDTLSVHRDVSEECDAGLISISFGCDGLFMIGHDNSDSAEVIRLRSGDAVYMSGQSRFAWHAVPKIVPATCPSWLKDWPSHTAHCPDEATHWNGWMSGKRINLNVRQMRHN